MATSNNKGGGFSIGAIYGLIASIVLYLVLCFVFPINHVSATAPAVGMESATIQAPEESAPGVAIDGSSPIAPDLQVATMAQPEFGMGDAITVGGGGDTSPANLVNPQIEDVAAQASEPQVETQSADVPVVGGAGTNAADPGQGEGQSITTASVETARAPGEAPELLARSASGPALEVFAVSFTGDTSKPMLAIILEDTLETSLQPLFNTGQPINFALPADVDSSESAQSIRESGYEVVAMLPSGMSRSEGVGSTTLQYMQNVPVAVALMDASTSGVMLNRNAMQEILAATRPAGLGVITFTGTGDLVARDQALRAGAAYGNVVQIIDKTADVDLILQALDRAAFDALTKGSSIVFARTKPETIEAIVRWMEGAFAQRLQIVPVSVAIQRPAN